MSRRIFAAIAAVCGFVSIGVAQSEFANADSDARPISPEENSLEQATVPVSVENVIRLRAELTKEVASGAITPTSALDRLKERGLSLGQSQDADADYALAAIDVGQQLNGSGFGNEALLFFATAETSLQRALGNAGERDTAGRVQLLQQLALIRGQFLEKPAQAEKNLAEALKLQPDNDYLLMLRTELIRSNWELFKASVSEEGRK